MIIFKWFDPLMRYITYSVNMFLPAIGFFILIQFNFAHLQTIDFRYGDGRNESLNKFLDAIVLNIESSSVYYKPLQLGNITGVIPKTSWISNFFQNYSLTNGQLFNFTTIKRYGDSQISYIDKILRIKLGAAVQELEVTYDFELIGLIDMLTQKGSLKASLFKFYITGDASANMKMFKVQTNELIISQPGKIDVLITPKTIISWLVNSILDLATSLFEQRIVTEVQEALKKAIDDFLNHWPNF